jgi:hypothetical protein
MTPIWRILASGLVVLAAGGLAGCSTDGTPSPGPVAQAPKPSLARSEAAKQCWMAAEKGRKDMSLDKRADVVTKCIDDKLKAAEATPES